MELITINEMCREVNIPSEENNLITTAEYLTRYYFTHKFRGKECDIIEQLYAHYVGHSILTYLTSMKVKTGIVVRENKYEQFLIEAKRDSYKTRKNILHCWLICVSKKIESQIPDIDYFVKMFPSVDMISSVREELGLDDNISRGE